MCGGPLRLDATAAEVGGQQLSFGPPSDPFVTPPKTIDVDGPGNTRSRHCLSDWEQWGHAALYSVLYEV
jgi:hypothetical protein